MVLLKQFQRLLGHMASAATVTLLGLLHMRPLQHWLHSRVSRWAWRCGKYRVTSPWSASCREDPRKCTIGAVLSFLQERLERRLPSSTLKVYVTAIIVHHEAVEGLSLGKHDLIVRFLRGARRLNPPRPPLVPYWDLYIVLTELQRGPFEQLDSVEQKILSAKTALLTRPSYLLVQVTRKGRLSPRRGWATG